MSQYSAIRFNVSDGESFVVKRVSVMRIAKYITDTLHKTTFGPNELSGAYEYALRNLESKLPEKDLHALLRKLKEWISA